MALTKITNSMVAGAPVNVLDYGASTSASAADNTTAFLAAKAAASTYLIAGSTAYVPVYVPPGIYAISGTVTGVFFSTGIVSITGGAVQYVLNAGVGVSFTNTIFGSGAMPAATPTGGSNGLENTAIGLEALAFNTTGYRNTGVGYGALRNSVTNHANTAVGSHAGYSLSDPAAYGNTVVGSRALFASVTGYFNTAIGSDSLTANLGGYQNTGCGKNTLYSNTTGYNNAALGTNALYSAVGAQNNTASGSYAGFALVDGYANTVAGFQALYNCVSGFDSVAIGVQALLLSTGSNNTAIGRSAGAAVTTGAGNVIVGTLSATGANVPVFNVVAEDNRVVIGSTSVTNAYVKTAWTIVSDARDKTDFAPVPHGLDFITKLQPTAFRYKLERDGTDGHGPLRYGFKAQDILALEGANPVIIDNEDVNKLRIVDSSLIPVLVKAIQELKAEFDAYRVAHP